MSTPNGPYDPYSQQQDSGQQQPPYGGQQPPYGQQQPPYGQPGYGQQQYASYPGGPYGSPQPGYGSPYTPPPGGPDGYLRGGPVGFGDAVKLAFQNAFNYQGRASRSAYWWYALATGIVYLVLDIIFVAAIGGGAGVALFYLIALAGIIVSLPLAVRRLHDIDKTGWWLLIALVPFGGIVILVFSLMAGTPGPNRFG